MTIASRLVNGLTVLVLLVVLTSGCGYQFWVEGEGPTIGGAPAKVHRGPAPRLAVLTFENRSFEPNIEVKYTNYARREFAAGSGASVVPEAAGADLVLKGQILSVIIPTLAFNLTEGTQESRVQVFVQASVQDARTKKVIWSESVTASSEFFVTRDLQFNRVLQTRALEQAGQFAAQDLATRFLNHLETYGVAEAQPVPAPAPSPSPDRRGSGPDR